MKSKLLDTLASRVVVFDGAMGTTLHELDLPLDSYCGCENCSEILVETEPDAIQSIHESYLEVGCDAVETDSFGGSRLVLGEFKLDDKTRELNRKAAEIARKACDKYSTPEQPRFVIGSIGPGTKLPTLGQVPWDVLLESFQEQIRGLIDGKADALIIETCQDILQTKCAIVAAQDIFEETGIQVPIICSITIETTGTMLVGTETLAAITALQPYDTVQVLGLNCATGPTEMAEHVRVLADHSDRYLIVQPNAGLPQIIDGQPQYTLTPDELARWAKEFVTTDGINIFGGCCGTTPPHLAKVVETVRELTPAKRIPQLEPSSSSVYTSVPIWQDSAVLAIGERTNANGSKQFRELLIAEDIDGMVRMGRDQVKDGSHVLDVCVACVGRDESKDMANVMKRYVTDVTVPLMIDSTEPKVLEEALKFAGGRCIINSVNLEDGEGRFDTVCQLARRYGAALVALTIDEEGMARTTERKVSIARRMFELATKRHGIKPTDLIFDTLTFTVCTGNSEDRSLALETLNALSLIKSELPGVHTMLGVSNVSFGLKPAARKVLNSVFLHYAHEHGLDAAIMHAGKIVPLFKIDEHLRNLASDIVFGRFRDDYDPLLEMVKLFEEEVETDEEEDKTPKTVEERLKHRIVDGDRVGLEEDLAEAMTTTRPLDIVNDILLDAMKTVGDLFGAGQMQLPFVLQSAETMKAAVKHLEPFLDKTDSSGRGTIILATVRGDVHDIGKNLVDIILTNNGFTVHNLGVKQPIASIVEAAEKHNADAIGMSGLLVKSTVVMGENLDVLEAQGSKIPVILGGAALTRKFVEQDLRKRYKEPLFYAKDAFDGLDIMTKLAEGTLTKPEAKVAKKDAAASQEPSRVPHPAESGVSRTVPIPTPPFWGSKVIEHIDPDAVLPYLNKNMLYSVQWQYRRAGRPKEEWDRFIRDEVDPIFRDMVERCKRENILDCKAIYGYWPTQSDGDTVFVYDPDDHSNVVAEFEFPRMRKSPFWCLADFFRPVDSGEMDIIGFSVVTSGRQVTEVERKWMAEDQYRDYLHLHGLGVEVAEATAEYLHKQIREELGIGHHDAREIRDMFVQGYQGSRYSFGYPACPRLEDQVRLWPLLEPHRIGVALSEGFQLEPEQCTTALITHHPEARYFSVQ